jgi:hypothetical protein
MKTIKNLITALCLVCMLGNCAQVDTELGKRRQWQVAVGTPIHNMGKGLTQTGAGIAIVTSFTPILIPLAIVPGFVPLIIIGQPTWIIGGKISGKKVDTDGFGL